MISFQVLADRYAEINETQGSGAYSGVNGFVLGMLGILLLYLLTKDL